MEYPITQTLTPHPHAHPTVEHVVLTEMTMRDLAQRTDEIHPRFSRPLTAFEVIERDAVNDETVQTVFLSTDGFLSPEARVHNAKLPKKERASRMIAAVIASKRR